MKKTVKVNTINKYQKVFYGELAMNAAPFCNNMTSFFSAETIKNACK